jgi:serine protease Do
MLRLRATQLVVFFSVLGLLGFIGVSLFPISKQSGEAFGSSPAIVDANIFVNLSKKIVPSVVNISSFSTVKSSMMTGDPNDALRRFFGEMFRQYNRGGNGLPPRGGDNGDEDEEVAPGPPGGAQKLPKALSLGTGFIIDASGLILTNNHVVADADEIKISFTEATDEKPSDAEVVGRDPDIDVALIRVKNKREMIPVSFGDSDALEVGEYVMAVGNPVGHGHSVTHGIISAKGRPAPDFPLANYLQTDAPINPGNSGGPLVNLKGEVIGINNAIDQRAQGIGFAIPINLVKKVLPQLRTKGVVARGYIGVLVDDVSPEIAKKIGLPKDSAGPVVTHVYPGDPADVAGVKPYDLILEFNSKPIRSANELIGAVTSVNVGDTVPMKVSRGKLAKVLSIRVGQRSGASQAPAAPEKQPKKEQKKPAVQTGMTLENVTPAIARDLGLSAKASGVVVSNVSYGSPADKAGLLRGDIILEVDRKAVKDVTGFYNTVKEKKSYLLRVRRSDPQGSEAFSVIVLDLKE